MMLAPPETWAKRQEAESCEGVGGSSAICSSNILMASQSVSQNGQSLVEKGAGSWRIFFHSSATFSTTLPISLYSESEGLA